MKNQKTHYAPVNDAYFKNCMHAKLSNRTKRNKKCDAIPGADPGYLLGEEGGDL